MTEHKIIPKFSVYFLADINANDLLKIRAKGFARIEVFDWTQT